MGQWCRTQGESETWAQRVVFLKVPIVFQLIFLFILELCPDFSNTFHDSHQIRDFLDLASSLATAWVFHNCGRTDVINARQSVHGLLLLQLAEENLLFARLLLALFLPLPKRKYYFFLRKAELISIPKC